MTTVVSYWKQEEQVKRPQIIGPSASFPWSTPRALAARAFLVGKIGPKEGSITQFILTYNLSLSPLQGQVRLCEEDAEGEGAP